MRWMLIVAVLVGCDPCSCEPSAEIKARAAELSSGFKSQAAEHHSKTIAAIDSTRQEIVSQNEQIIDTLKIVEASLVKSEPKQLGGDPASALEPQEAAKANPSQPSKPVASPPAVRSSGPIKLSWNVEGNWSPSILETAKHLREDHGVNVNDLNHQQLHDLHAALHEGRKVANKSQPVQMINRGTQCPGGVCPTVRRGLFGRRR
jgi:hypothetical protein